MLSVYELHVLRRGPYVTSEYAAQVSACGSLPVPLLFNDDAIGGLGFVGSQDRPIVVLDLELEAPNVNDVVGRGLLFLSRTPTLSVVAAHA